jgi:hypothetical protein
LLDTYAGAIVNAARDEPTGSVHPGDGHREPQLRGTVHRPGGGGTTDLPRSETPEGDGVVFRFEGPVENVDGTLIVRLTRSNRFIVGSRIGPWQEQELTAFLRQPSKRRRAVVPVLLPGARPRDLWSFSMV